MTHIIKFSIFNAHTHDLVKDGYIYVQAENIEVFLDKVNSGKYLSEGLNKVCWKECRILESAMEEAVSAMEGSMKDTLDWALPITLHGETTKTPDYVYE
jgi:hypothetical protein